LAGQRILHGPIGPCWLHLYAAHFPQSRRLEGI